MAADAAVVIVVQTGVGYEMFVKFILILTLALLTASPAQAHRPYLIKEGMISDPNGKPLILEKLYGDGIFTTDPARFQIRSANGAVLAATPTAGHVAVFCPHIKHCWAFLYETFALFAAGMKLDHKFVDWNAPAPELALKDDEILLFKKYLEDEGQKRAHSYDFGYPEMLDNNKGFIASPVSIIFSPLLIIGNHIIPLVLAAVLSVAPFILHWLFFRRFNPHGKLHGILLRTSGGIIIFGYMLFYALTLFILGFTVGTPLLYMLGATTLGALLPKLIRKEKLGARLDASKQSFL